MAKKFPRRAIHLDFHTMPGIVDIGAEFNGGEFALTLKNACVDYITVFAKCNLGFAYYPTEIGTVYPGLKKDLLGEMIDSCHKEGIMVSAYFNAGLDHDGALKHREWCKVNKNGQVYEMPARRHFFRKMCLNSEYGNRLYEMVEEVLEKYPVDGIFLDSVGSVPCYGFECLEGIESVGGDVLNDGHVEDFARKSVVLYTKKITRLVKKRRPGIFVFYNGLHYGHQPTHIELEVLPTVGWGYDSLPPAIRFARTLKKNYLTMTGRFHGEWGDFGGLRPEHSLLYDCFYSIANGGTCSVGDHMHPRGKLEPEVYKLVGSVYSRIKSLERWTEGARPCAEICIIEPLLDQDNNLHAGISGAARMLSELKYQFDVSSGSGNLDKYRVLVLPDTVVVDEALKKKLSGRLKAGAFIISSGFSGLEPGKSRFALEEYRIHYDGEAPFCPSYLKAAGGIGESLPDMPVAVYDRAIAMRPGRGAEVLAELIKPYFSMGFWDGYHNYLYTPPDREAEMAAVIRTGNVFHFSFPVFGGYFEHAAVHYRTLFHKCLREALRDPVLKVENLPSFGHASLARKNELLIVHLLSYVPEKRGKMFIIEEPFPAREVSVCVRDEKQNIKKAYLAPELEKIEIVREGCYARVAVRDVPGYRMVVFETG